VVAFLLMLELGVGQSVPRQPSKSTKPVSAKAESVLEAPVEGDDIVKLIDSLLNSGADAAKGEFETTADYESRRRALSETFTGKAFIFPLPLTEQSIVKYDADRGRMLFSISSNLFSSNVDARLPTIAVKRKIPKSGTYTASNAFGVRKEITVGGFMEDGLVVANNSPISDRALQSGWEFQADPQHASEMKSSLCLAIVGRVAEPRVISIPWRHAPTITEPYDSMHVGRYVPFLVQEVRVLDSRTGVAVVAMGGK